MNDTDKPTREKLRQAVVDVATNGWRPPCRPRRAKHVQEKDPAWDRFLSVKDACRTLSEIIGEHGPEAVMAGALDAAARHRAAAVIHSGFRDLRALAEYLADGQFDRPKPHGPATDAVDRTEADIAPDRPEKP